MILTEKQLACLRLAAEGHSSSEIAKQLYLSETTVKNYLGHARTALRANNTTHAVAIAVSAGLIGTPVTKEVAVRVALTHISRALGYELVPQQADLTTGGAG